MKSMLSFLIWGRDDKKRAALKQDLGAARLTFKNLYLLKFPTPKNGVGMAISQEKFVT